MHRIELSDRWVERQLIERLPRNERVKASLKNLLKSYSTIAELIPAFIAPSVLQLTASTALMARAVRRGIKEEKTLFQHSKILESRGLGSTAKNLEGIIDRLPDFQAFIYATDEFYRDHIEHQIRVAVLGDFLLSQHFEYDGERIKLVDRICSATDIAEEDVSKAWWIASLFHDTGIPVAKLSKNLNDFMGDLAKVYEKVNLGLSHVDCPIPNEDENRLMFKALSKGLSKPTVTKLRAALGWDGTSRIDHGAISALLLLRSIPKLASLGYDELVDQLEHDFKPYLMAAQAIVFHNLYQDANRIEIDSKDNPLAYLLVCCDEMQEWNRDVSIKVRSVFDPKFGTTRLMDHCFVELSSDSIELLAEFENQEAKDNCGFVFDYYVAEKKLDLHRLKNTQQIFPKIRLRYIDHVFHEHKLVRRVEEKISTDA